MTGQECRTPFHLHIPLRFLFTVTQRFFRFLCVPSRAERRASGTGSDCCCSSESDLRAGRGSMYSAPENRMIGVLLYQLIRLFFVFVILSKTMKPKIYVIFEHCFRINYYFFVCIIKYSEMKSECLYCDIGNYSMSHLGDVQ